MATARYNKIRNERRKAQRRIKAIDRQLEKTESLEARKTLEARKANLEAGIEASRMYSKETGKKIRSDIEVERGVKYLEAQTRKATTYVQSHKQQNKATAIEINRAGSGGMYTKREVQLFFKETQWAWNREDVKPKDRLNAIMEAYGENDLAALFDRLINEESVREIEYAKEILDNPDCYTDEEKIWAHQVLNDNNDAVIDSPDSRKSKKVKWLPVEAPNE